MRGSTTLTTWSCVQIPTASTRCPKAGMVYTRSPAELGSTMLEVLKAKGMA